MSVIEDTTLIGYCFRMTKACLTGSQTWDEVFGLLLSFTSFIIRPAKVSSEAMITQGLISSFLVKAGLMNGGQLFKLGNSLVKEVGMLRAWKCGDLKDFASAYIRPSCSSGNLFFASSAQLSTSVGGHVISVGLLYPSAKRWLSFIHATKQSTSTGFPRPVWSARNPPPGTNKVDASMYLLFPSSCACLTAFVAELGRPINLVQAAMTSGLAPCFSTLLPPMGTYPSVFSNTAHTPFICHGYSETALPTSSQGYLRLSLVRCCPCPGQSCTVAGPALLDSRRLPRPHLIDKNELLSL